MPPNSPPPPSSPPPPDGGSGWNSGPQWGQPPGPDPYGVPAAPPGYVGYGGPGSYEGPRGRSGMAVASMVLSLVGLIPFFWLLQIPAVLGVIFGFIGLNQTKNGQRSGRGMAIAGLVIGFVLIAIAVLIITLLVVNDCEFTNDELVCPN